MSESNGEIVLNDDATVKIRVQSGPNDGKIMKHDLMLLKLTAEPVERDHKVPDDPGKILIDGGFLSDLAAAYREAGVDSCTPMMAYQLWNQVNDLWTNLEKKITNPRNLPDSTESTPML